MIETFPQIDEEFQAKYEVLETVGAGGMGVIYRARHKILNRIVAVKMVHAHLLSPEVIKRFYHEGKASSSLSHPYIVKVLDFGTTQSGQPYMILDFVDGKTLSNVLATVGSLTTEHFLSLFLQITEALSYAHKHGVLHRDIKPANIMLVENARGEEEIRIMDFGLARIVDDTEYAAQHLTKTGVAMGSPLYMSPEHARGSNMDERSDQYSLGCTMYEALTGTPPFVGKTPFETLLMHLNEPPLPLGEASLGKIIDPRLEQIVLKTLAKNLADRYQSMEELSSALKESSNQPVADAPVASKYKSDKTKIAILAGTLTVALSIAGVSYFGATHIDMSSTRSASPSSTLRSAAPSLKLSASTSLNMPEKIETSSGDTKDSFDLIADVTRKQLVEGLVREKHPSIINLSKYSRVRMTNSDLEPLREAQWTSKIILKGLPIDDGGLPFLSKLKLRSLDLESTRVKNLTPLKDMKTLVDLSVAHTFLNSEGMKTIANLPELKTLDLSATKIVDRDLRLLYGLRKLSYVDLSGCENLSKVAVDKLENAIAPCKVSFIRQELSDYEPLTLSKDATLDLAVGNWSKAYEKFTTASSLLTNSSDQSLKTRCLFGAGDAQFMGRDFARAADLYNQATVILGKSKPNDPITAEVNTKKAFAEEMLHKPAEAIKSRNIVDEIYQRLHVAKQGPLADLRAQNLLKESSDLAILNQSTQSAAKLKMALSLLPEDQQYSEPVAHTAQAVGISFMREKNHREAIPFFERTLKFYDSQYPKYQSAQALLRQQIAESCNIVGRCKDAEAILKQTIDLPADQVLRNRRFTCLIDTLKKENKNSEAKNVEKKRDSR
ncbi:hypothetical protein BH10CYA1_BH10CYA1_50090 [soil metagenome]